MGASMGVTHGTATRMKATGKAKWRSHGFPPNDQMTSIVRQTTASACAQLSGRQSGLATSNNRTGKRMTNETIAMTTAITSLTSDFRPLTSDLGPSSQRSQKRKAAKNGTNQP